MAEFKNREELLDFLLDDTQVVINEMVKHIVVDSKVNEELNIVFVTARLEKLYSRIENYRKMYPKETD